MEGIGIHMVPVEQVPAEGLVIPVERSAARASIRPHHIFRYVVTGVEHERGVSVNADVSDAEKERAGGFADPFNAESFAADVVAADDGDKVRDISAVAVSDRRTFRGSGYSSAHCN